MNLKDRLTLSYVPRWTIVPMMRQQSVADHSFRVAMITIELMAIAYGELGFVPHLDFGAVLHAALLHDEREAITGDIPAPRKPVEVPHDVCGLIVKAADIVETRTWLRMWGHQSVVAKILVDNESRYEVYLGALEAKLPGMRGIVLRLERELVEE